MIVCGLMSWFDEKPSDLHRAIFSAATAGMSRLVALDGRYALYPAEEACSPIEQLEAIENACDEFSVALEYHRPVIAWPSEAIKRSYLFKMADEFTDDVPDEDAWYLILDADYTIVRTGRAETEDLSLTDLLQGTDCDAAETKLYHPPSAKLPTSLLPDLTTTRCLFRGRGITVGPYNHYTYVRPDGERMWGRGGVPTVEAFDLTEDVTVVHGTFHRTPERMAAQVAYYDNRDATGNERGPCDICGRTLAIAWLADATTFQEIGHGQYDGLWLEVCRDCIAPQAERNIDAIRKLGLDPNDSRLTTPLGVVRGAL